MNQRIKQIASWAIGVPAAVLATSEVSAPKLWWIPLAAAGAILLVLKWNGLLENPANGRSL